MQEDNLLSLSYGRIVRKKIDSAEGLLPESFETYQIVEPGNIVMRLTDLQNDKRSIRQGLVTERGIITSAYDALEVRENSDPRFWSYTLLALDLAKYYYSLGGGVRQSVKFSDFPNEWLGTPDPQTQVSISDFLDRETARIDKLIEKKQRLVEALATARLSTISRAVTVGLDNGAELAQTNSPYLPTVRQGWKVWRLKHLAKVNGGLTLGRIPSPGEALRPTPYLRVANVQAGWLDLTDVAEVDATESEIRRYSLRDGDVLMNEGGDNDKLGRGAVWTAPFSPCLNQNHVFAVRPKNRLYSEWISLATNARYARDFFFLHSNQSTNLASISKTNLERFPVAIPPLEAMQTILARVSERLSRLARIAAKTTSSIDRLRELRAAIITAAVTGQIEIREKLPTASIKPDRSKFRIIVGAEIVHQHQGNPKFGRVKLQKELYLAEAHLGIDDLRGNYLREAAGPLDRALIEETERGLEVEGFYRAIQRDGTGTAVTYAPLAKAGQHKAELESLLGPKADKLRGLIKMLRDLDRREVEAVATLYAVWNDALMDGVEPDDEVVINGVLTEWHTEKGEKFKTDDLSRWLGWMKRHSLTPQGQGPRTAHTRTRDMFA